MARPIDPEKRNAILQAARKIILRDGYQAAKISSIAGEAGVAPGTVYLYFDSKEAIATGIASDFFERAGALIQQHVPHLAEDGGIEAYIDAFVQFASPEKEILAQIRPDPRLAEDESSRQKRKELLGQMSNLLTALMDEGRIHRYDATALGSILFGLLHSIMMSAVVFEDIPLDICRKTATIILRRALIPAK